MYTIAVRSRVPPAILSDTNPLLGVQRTSSRRIMGILHDGPDLTSSQRDLGQHKQHRPPVVLRQRPPIPTDRICSSRDPSQRTSARSASRPSSAVPPIWLNYQRHHVRRYRGDLQDSKVHSRNQADFPSVRRGDRRAPVLLVPRAGAAQGTRRAADRRQRRRGMGRYRPRPRPRRGTHRRTGGSGLKPSEFLKLWKFSMLI